MSGFTRVATVPHLSGREQHGAENTVKLLSEEPGE